MPCRPPCRPPYRARLRPGRQRGAGALLLLLMIALGGSMLLMKTFSNQRREAARERDTLATLALAREALLGYAALHGRLPRPAVSAGDGREAAECGNDAECTGFLPWVTLGVSGTDNWGKLLRYSVTPAFTSAPVDPNLVLADKRVVARQLNRLVYRVGATTCDGPIPCAPAVVMSQGRHNPGTSAAGTALVSDSNGNLDEVSNHRASNDFISRQSTSEPNAAGGEFDDLLVWVPLAQLKRQLSISTIQQQ